MLSFVSARYLVQSPHSILENGFMAIEGSQIKEVGLIQDLASSQKAELIANPKHYDLITPGFINTHTHLELSYPYSIPLNEGESMGDWLYQVFLSRQKPYIVNEQELLPEVAIAHRIESGIQQMLKSGVTTVNDISAQGESLALLSKHQMRGFVSLEFFHPNTRTFHPESLDSTIEQYFELQACVNPSSMLTVGLSPHALYNVSPKAWKHVIQACKPALVHTHLAESKDEMAWLFHRSSASNTINQLHQTILKQTFPSPLHPKDSGKGLIEQMANFELLQEPTILAHGVYLNDADHKILKNRTLPVSLAHCPQSNFWLQNDTLSPTLWQYPFPIPMGLGTDSQLSVGSLDIRHDARLLKERFQLSPLETLDILTLQGARALFLEDNIGTLIPKKQADWLGWQFSNSADDTSSLADMLEACLTPGQKPVSIQIGGRTIQFDFVSSS